MPDQEEDEFTAMFGMLLVLFAQVVAYTYS